MGPATKLERGLRIVLRDAGLVDFAVLNVDQQNTTVVDLTYLCNASCRYCQWGNKITPGRWHRPVNEILLQAENLRALGTQRVVLSGGEPRLHPQLVEILGHYHELVDYVIVITNGYGLDTREVSRLVEAGATGITVSLDSLSPGVSMRTRETSSALHSQIVSNLRKIAQAPRKFELGVNSVVSHPTANWANVKELLEFGSDLQLDFMKFQPVFDDGYVGQNAPELKLTSLDGPNLLEVSEQIDSISHPSTNPGQFWRELAAVASGEHLQPMTCGLGPRHSLLTRDKLNICYWLDSASFDFQGGQLSPDKVDEVREMFDREKATCKVDFHCFCNQNIAHVWKEPPV